jgi:hypothetical protein
MQHSSCVLNYQYTSASTLIDTHRWTQRYGAASVLQEVSVPAMAKESQRTRLLHAGERPFYLGEQNTTTHWRIQRGVQNTPFVRKFCQIRVKITNFES